MKLRGRLRAKVNIQSADVSLHPTIKKGDDSVSIERVMVMLAGGRSRLKNIVAAIEWDNGNTQVISNTMKRRDLAYLGARVAALIATEIDS